MDTMTRIAAGEQPQPDKTRSGWFAEEQTTLPGMRTAFSNLRTHLNDTIDGLMLRHELDDLLRRLADVVKGVLTAVDGDKDFFASTLKNAAEADTRRHLVLWFGDHPLGTIDHVKGRSNRQENAPPLQDVPAATRPGILEQIDSYHDAIAAEVVGLLYHRVGANPYTKHRMEEALRQAGAGPGGVGTTGVTRIATRADFERVYGALCADAVLSRRPFYGDALRSCAAAIVASDSTATSASKLLCDLVSTQAKQIEKHLGQVNVNQAPFPVPVLDVRDLPRPAGLRGAAATAWEDSTRNHLLVSMVAVQATAQTAINLAVSELRSNIAEFLAMADATGHHSLITPEVKHEVMALQAQHQGPGPFPRVTVTHLAAAGALAGSASTKLDKVLVTAAKAFQKKPQQEHHAQTGAAAAAAAAAGTNGGGGAKKRKPPDPIQQSLAAHTAETASVGEPKRGRGDSYHDHGGGRGRGLHPERNRGRGIGARGGRGSGGRGFGRNTKYRGRGYGADRAERGGYGHDRNRDFPQDGGGGGGGAGPTCQHCGRPGHTVDVCDAFAHCQLCNHRHRGRYFCTERRERTAPSGAAAASGEVESKTSR